MVTVSCPNEGCKEAFIKSQLDGHVQNCQYSRNVNDQLNTQDVSSGHGFVAKGKLALQKCQFAFIGCQFIGNDSELAKHMEKDINNHLECICKALVSHSHSSHKPNGYVPTSENNEAMKQLLSTDFGKQKQISSDKDKTNLQPTERQGKTGVEDLLATLQASITEINRTYEEVSLTLQTLQATSYNGKYIWKIPDITRRRRDAVMGKTVSLYSAPFYTDRLGYRMCLRVYLDGDGSGKGRYISFFLTIMKGEYDALLEWPFQLTVTLTMINQKGSGNIVQSFKPITPAVQAFSDQRQI